MFELFTDSGDKIIYSIKRVKEIFFSVNERLYAPDPDKMVQLELGHLLGFNMEMNLVNFTIRVFYHYPEHSQQEVLAEVQVENLFEVQDLQKFMTNTGIVILPNVLISSIVGISLSHARALLSKNTAGTSFQEIIIPITNPTEVAKFFFPYMFEQETEVIQTDISGNIKAKETIGKIEKSPQKSRGRVATGKRRPSKNSY